eukprot:6201927-Prorocentrum_lima.AAC.1
MQNAGKSAIGFSRGDWPVCRVSGACHRTSAGELGTMPKVWKSGMGFSRGDWPVCRVQARGSTRIWERCNKYGNQP